VQACRWSLHCLQLLAGCACARFCALKPMKTKFVSDVKIRMLSSRSHFSLLSLGALKWREGAGDQPLRHALDPTGVAGQRLHGVRHDKLLPLSSPWEGAPKRARPST